MQRLGNLCLLYDDNHISIEDDTSIALSEDVAARYEALGWHVQRVDWLSPSGGYDEDVQALADAYDEARRVTDRPSFITLRTVIALAGARRAEHRQGPRQRPRRRRGGGDQDGAGLRPRPHLPGRRRGPRHTRVRSRQRGQALHAEWQPGFDAWAAANPDGRGAARPA